VSTGDEIISDGSFPAAGRVPARLSLSRQFLRYVLCAGLAAGVNFAAGSVLVDGFGFTTMYRFPLAVALAYIAGMAVNFLLNRQITFRSDRTGLAQARTFIVVALSGLALTIVIAALCRAALGTPLASHILAPLGKLGSPETVSRVAAIGLAAIYSFAAHKYFTFNRGLRSPLLAALRSLRPVSAGG
jgi:putative flippase GtrA